MVRSTTARDSTVAALVWAVALASGCTRLDSLPTEPAAAPAIDGPWERIYPALTAQTLRAVWGMDADDMWAGGECGVMLHFDGRRLERVPFPGNGTIMRIDGLASDAVWALDGGRLYRWDGHTWTLSHELPHFAADFCVLSEREIYIGGDAWADTCNVPAVQRFDGTGWTRMDFPHRPRENFGRVWRPSSEHLLMATTDAGVYRLNDERWEQTYWSETVRDVDRHLGIIGDGFSRPVRLAEFLPDGEVIFACDGHLWPGSQRVVVSRVPLIASATNLRAIVDCELFQLADGFPGDIADWNVPVRPGVEGPAIFGVGEEAAVLRGIWQPDGRFSWENLNQHPSERLDDRLVGNAECLFAASDGDLIVQHDDGWLVAPVGFDIGSLYALDNGRVAVCGRRDVAVREMDGTFAPLPSAPVDLFGVWSDGLRAWGGDWDGQLWTLSGGAWTAVAAMPYVVGWIGAEEPSEPYLLAAQRLWQWNGSELVDLTARPDVRIEQCYLGPSSGRIFVHGVSTQNYWDTYAAVFDHGEWHEFTVDGFRFYPRIWEIDAETVVAVQDRRLYRFVGDGWQQFDELADPYEIIAVWGHPDRGLFVVTSDSRILHRDMPDVDAARR